MIDLDKLGADEARRYEGLEPPMATIAARAKRRRRTRRTYLPLAVSVLLLLFGAVVTAVIADGRTQRLEAAGTPASITNTTDQVPTPTEAPLTTTPQTAPDPTAACGNLLPIKIGLAVPAEPRSDEISVTNDGVLVRQITDSTGTVVEVFWPARPRVLYDLEVEIPWFFPVRLESPNPANPSSYLLTALTPNEEPVEPAIDLLVPPLTPSLEDLPPGCAIAEIVVVNHEQQTTSYGWDLTKSDWQPFDGATNFPIVNLAPMITSTERITTPTSSALGCDANTVTPDTIEGTGPTDTFDTPAEALAAFLDTEPAETFIKSGFHEMIADDGSYTYGIVSDIPTRTPQATDDFVTIITATELTDGWRVTDWTASGC